MQRRSNCLYGPLVWTSALKMPTGFYWGLVSVCLYLISESHFFLILVYRSGDLVVGWSFAALPIKYCDILWVCILIWYIISRFHCFWMKRHVGSSSSCCRFWGFDSEKWWLTPNPNIFPSQCSFPSLLVYKWCHLCSNAFCSKAPENPGCTCQTAFY